MPRSNAFSLAPYQGDVTLDVTPGSETGLAFGTLFTAFGGVMTFPGGDSPAVESARAHARPRSHRPP